MQDFTFVIEYSFHCGIATFTQKDLNTSFSTDVRRVVHMYYLCNVHDL